MRRLSLVPTVLVALAIAVGPASAATFPPRIELPDGWAPEGIASGRGMTAWVGSLNDGAIARLDLRTGDVDPTFVAGIPGEVAVGLEYDGRGDRIWVAGGGTGEVRAY